MLTLPYLQQREQANRFANYLNFMESNSWMKYRSPLLGAWSTLDGWAFPSAPSRLNETTVPFLELRPLVQTMMTPPSAGTDANSAGSRRFFGHFASIWRETRAGCELGLSNWVRAPAVAARRLSWPLFV